MSVHAHASFAQWHNTGPHAPYLRARRSSGGLLDLLEVARPAGDMSRPALPDLVLVEVLIGCRRVRADLGGGRFDVATAKGALALSAPNFATTVINEEPHWFRSLAFP